MSRLAAGQREFDVAELGGGIAGAELPSHFAFRKLSIVGFIAERATAASNGTCNGRTARRRRAGNLPRDSGQHLSPDR